jgi:competence protein ComEC
MLLVALGPLWYRSATLTQVTVLAAAKDPVLVLQDHQSSLLVNSGIDRTGFYTVLPFLRQAGINRLDYGINAGHSDPENWRTIASKTPIDRIYQVGDGPVGDLPVQRLSVHQPQPLGRQQVTALASPATALQFTFWANHSWLLLSGLNPTQQEQILTAPTTLASEVLWWDGSPLSPTLLAAVQPRVAIAATRQLSTELEQSLKDKGIQVFCPERDGAISWHPHRGYRAYLAHQFAASQPLD